jgi:Holliday junction DNA helicase RuvA
VIASLTGIVKSSSATSAIIEVGGVGMLVLMPAKNLSTLTVGKSASVYTSLVVREDSLTLFGFETPTARDLFETLQTVTGIGPKVSQSALSIFEPEELIEAIASGDNGLLERIPGLGKKGAQRVIIDLKDKVGSVKRSTSKSDWRNPLESALTGLGFTSKEIEKLLDETAKHVGTDISSKSASDLLKIALQLKGRG